MSVVHRSSPGGEVTFCDDIRFEQYNKHSLIGVYSSELVLHGSFPASLPKLGIAISYFERPGESTEPVQLRVTMQYDDDGREDEVFAVDLPVDALRNVTFPEHLKPGLEKFIVSFVPLIVTPFRLLGPGRVFVKAFRGSDEIRIGSMAIRQATPEELPTRSAPP